MSRRTTRQRYTEPVPMMYGWQPQTTRIRSVPPIAPTVRMRSLQTHANVAEAPKCLNCDELLVGKFCHACGQSAKTPARISVGAVLHDLPHAILHLEHALPHTVLSLLRRPGHTIRAYLEGKRVKMYSPFTLLFMVAGLMGLALVTFKLTRGIPNLQLQSTSEEISLKSSQAVLKYQAWIRLAMVPFVAMGPTLVLKSRTGLRYGEHLVAAAMATAGSAMVTLLTIPFRWLIVRYFPQGAPAASVVAELLTTVYVVWAYAQLQDDGKRQDTARRWLRSVTALLVTCVLWLAALVTVSVVAILVISGAVLLNQKLHLFHA